MKKSTIFLLTLICFVVGLVIGTGIYLYKDVLSVETIYSGVKIDGEDIGGMGKEEALAHIKNNKEEEIKNKNMNLIYGEKVYKVSLEDLEMKYKYDKAIDEAYKFGRQGNIIERWKDIRDMRQNSKNIPLEAEYNKSKIGEIVGNISQEINKEPVDAKFHFNRGDIEITQEVMGINLLEEDLIKRINENIYKLDDIDIMVKEREPELTKDLLSRINGIIGEYSTSFRGSTKDRIENIRLSAQAFKGKILLPGEELSYNETTGPRERKYGYKEANVIIGGELTPGIGGGVCQTSTTIYNALLLSDLTILERHPHSIPPTYVNYGQDAAVAYGYLDLKFRNDFDYPIYIDSKVTNDRVYFYIYGDIKDKDYKVKISPKITETIHPVREEIFDETLPPGGRVSIQQGRTGYKVKTYKSIIRNGKEIKKENITSDHYRKKDHIYKVGPKQPLQEQERIDDKSLEKENKSLEENQEIDDKKIDQTTEETGKKEKEE